MTEFGRNGSYQRVALSENTAIELSWHAITNTGLRRENNQDSYVVLPPIFAVADGMGGHTAGEIASDAVAARLAQLHDAENVHAEDIDTLLRQAVIDIHDRVGATELGAGTTVTGLALTVSEGHPNWLVLNIGDSRVYQFFRGSLSQVTSDHSVVQHLIDTGAIGPEEADTHPHANVITRAVGFNEEPIPDYIELALIPGQRMLVCSDGLTKELTDFGIRHFLSTARTAKEAAEELVEQALQNSGRDNVTVIVIDVHAVGDMRETGDLSRTRLPLNDPSDTREVPGI